MFYHAHTAAVHLLRAHWKSSDGVPKYDLQMFGGVETQRLKCFNYVQRRCKGACSLSEAKFEIRNN